MKRDPHPRVSGRATPACSCDHNKRQVRRDSEPIDTRDGIPLMGFNPFKSKVDPAAGMKRINVVNTKLMNPYTAEGLNKMYNFKPGMNLPETKPLSAQTFKDVQHYKLQNPYTEKMLNDALKPRVEKTLSKKAATIASKWAPVQTGGAKGVGITRQGYVKSPVALPGMVREPVTGRSLPPTAKTSSAYNWSGGLGTLATLGAGLAVNQLYREYAPKSTGMDILNTAANVIGPVPGMVFQGLGALVGAATRGPALTSCEEALQMQKGSPKYDSDLDPDIWLARTHPDAYRETQANGVPGMPTYVPGKSVQEIIKSRYYQEFCDYVKSKVAASPEKQTQQPAQQAVEDNEIATCQYMTQAEVEAALKSQQAIQVGPSPQGRIGPK